MAIENIEDLAVGVVQGDEAREGGAGEGQGEGGRGAGIKGATGCGLWARAVGCWLWAVGCGLGPVCLYIVVLIYNCITYTIYHKLDREYD